MEMHTQQNAEYGNDWQFPINFLQHSRAISECYSEVVHNPLRLLIANDHLFLATYYNYAVQTLSTMPGEVIVYLE
jgi:hypothetical protein